MGIIETIGEAYTTDEMEINYMANKSVFQRAADYLSGKSTQSAADIERLMKELIARREEIDTWLKKIQSNGSDRERVLLNGTPDDVLKLDAQIEQLQAEQAAINERHKRLRSELEQARVNEARSGIKDLHRSMTASADQVIQARENLRQAEQKMEAQVGEFDRHQRLIGDAALMDPKDAEKVAQARIDPDQQGKMAAVQDRPGERSARAVSQVELFARKLSKQKPESGNGGVQRQPGLLAE